jgi:ABC-type polysaccharide/polyol phosphate export permease
MTKLADLAQSRELFHNLTLRELRGKYNRSVLGWAWSLLNPLTALVIFGVVFRFFLKVPVPVGDPSGMEIFAFFLLCGLLPWNYLQNGLNGAMGTLVDNANLIKKVYFPREVLVGSVVASWLFSAVIEMAVLAVALLVAGNLVLPWLPGVVVLLALQTVFIVGIGLGLSVVNVYFRDMQYLVGLLMQIWFYATPIVYPISMVPDRAEVLGFDLPLRTLYDLNPMTRFVEAYRDLLYDLRLPPPADLAYLVVVSAGCLAIGLAVFTKLEPRLAEEL